VGGVCFWCLVHAPPAPWGASRALRINPLFLAPAGGVGGGPAVVAWTIHDEDAAGTMAGSAAPVAAVGH
jgi:hypothetical protein